MSPRFHFPAFAFVLLALLACLTVSCAKKQGSTQAVAAPPVDSDHDGVADSQDQCPDLPGDPATGGCPWYKVDVCSTDRPYSLPGYYWTTNNPVFRFDTSLPTEWRSYCEYAASQWNALHTRLQIQVNRTPVTAGARQDQMCVVSRGQVPTGTLART